MKILADSNIFIKFWKKADRRIEDIFSDGTLDIVLCGPVRSELLHGAKTDKNFEAINVALNEFYEYNIGEEEWTDIGRLLYILRINGLNIPYADGLIAHIACKNDLQVWTRDQHFRLISEILPELRLFDENKWSIPDGVE